MTGVWLPAGKVAAVGMRIDRGVTRHRFALDVATPPGAWNVVLPCGLSQERVISVSSALGRPVSPGELHDSLLGHAAELLGRHVEHLPPRRASVQVVLYRRQPRLEVLLLRRVPARGGFWQPVTGMLEPGETPLQAARRELIEETGVAAARVRDLRYTHSFIVEPGIRPDPPPEPTFLQEFSFAAEAPPEATVGVDPREHDAMRWVPPGQAEELLRHSGNRRAVRILLDTPELRVAGIE